MSTLPPVPQGGMGTPPTLPAPAFSLFQRLHFFVRAHIIKSFVTSYFNIVSLLGIHQKQGSPTFLKVYQKGLTNRVFVPKSWKSGDAPLPLYLDIHGGGFTICSPMVDDRFCREFSDNNNFLVVSLDYPKAPAHPYPAPLNALTKAVKDVLADETLPFDGKMVAIGGFSAGANLALAVSQDEALHGKIGGVASFYAPLDFATDTKAKLATRPAHAGPDPLANIAPMFNWGYVPAGTNLKDPQLSPVYAPSSKLPPKLYIIGCELDLLCRESEILAERLASERSGEVVTSGPNWEKGGITFEKIIGEKHGFEMMPASGQDKIRVEKRRTEMLKSVSKWLLKEVYV